MGKSLVMPRAASFSTIRPEMPSFAISSPPSSPDATPASSPDPAREAAVALNPRGLGAPRNARRGGSSAGARRAGLGGAGGGERSAARRVLRHREAAGGGEGARARRSREIIVASGSCWRGRNRGR